MKLVKKVHKGETVKGYFSYLNDLKNVNRARSTATSPEFFASIDGVEEVLRVLSCTCISQTVAAINSTKGSQK
jgi:hypothetical protein